MSPDGSDKPDGELAAAIDEHFGSFDGFRAQFTANVLGVQVHRRPTDRAAVSAAGPGGSDDGRTRA